MAEYLFKFFSYLVADCENDLKPFFADTAFKSDILVMEEVVSKNGLKFLIVSQFLYRRVVCRINYHRAAPPIKRKSLVMESVLSHNVYNDYISTLHSLNYTSKLSINKLSFVMVIGVGISSHGNGSFGSDGKLAGAGAGR